MVSTGRRCRAFVPSISLSSPTRALYSARVGVVNFAMTRRGR